MKSDNAILPEQKIHAVILNGYSECGHFDAQKFNIPLHEVVNMKLLLTDAQRIQITKTLLEATSILMNLQSCTSYCKSCGSRNVTTYSNHDLDEMAYEAHLQDELSNGLSQ